MIRNGFEVGVISGPPAGRLIDDQASWAERYRDWHIEPGPEGVAVRSDGLRASIPPHSVVTNGEVRAVVHRWPSGENQIDSEDRAAEFSRFLEIMLDQARPEVVVCDILSNELFRGIKHRSIKTVYLLDEFAPCQVPSPEAVDVVLSPTRFHADYIQAALGVPSVVLPTPTPARPRGEPTSARFVTMVDPTPTRGAWIFARIADELRQRRPDIPLLVVEGRGTEANLAACGLDLRLHGNLHVMAAPADVQDYLKLTKLLIEPAVGWDSPTGVVNAAQAIGALVIVSNRGSLPEAIKGAGEVLQLPDRITPATRSLPTSEEVAPWVEAIIKLWDDPASSTPKRLVAEAGQDHTACRRRLFTDLRSRAAIDSNHRPLRAKSVVLVPHLNGIDWECEQGLRALEQGGVKIIRRRGSSAIDAARNELVSNALHDGFESMLFIDADIGFAPTDAFRILARPELVLCGIYAKKGRRGLASYFADGTGEVLFGPDAPGPYPVQFAATGFLRIRSSVLRLMIDRLELPLCNTKWGRGIWPFFMPMIIPHDGNKLHYLGEDWAFSHRLAEVGITALADTSIRLWHWGRHPFGWEDAGQQTPRYRSYNFRVSE